ncbi:methyl-accepting chemotaxis protein [Natranaerobius thermophilus]|uniref:Methyl-accepting chemotaxis sensory transducer n=1 Tax=Natranaerobius thermophilus (strain ATCC BAA-1301 / DSM 18059 / JW/NM-WN-LF) TaxID=457570 RepID=B2A0N4_NATTJ|nr:methyl-accepting chemotaxis protein [Natranaerobius thermophilus]ACB84592.1 methyl-accepting chemotaxis sensory transducer [Natranaerobius thermophilus JW/NM-WN-LF]
MLNNMGIKPKLMLFIVLIIVIATACFWVLNNYTVNNIVDERAANQLDSEHSMSMRLIDEHSTGAWTLMEREDRTYMYKGGTPVHTLDDVLDEFHEKTGSAFAVFRRDTIEATTIEGDDGERIIGAQAEERIAETVLEEGENYSGEVEIAGTSYEARYAPLEDEDGNIVGMWLVGTPVEEINQMVSQAGLNFLMFSGLIIIISLIITHFITNNFTKPIKNLTSNISKLADYDFTFDEDSVTNNYLNRKDEIGIITNALTNMQTNIISLIKNINEKSEQVASSAEEMSANSEENTNAANEVSRAVEDIASGATNQAEKTEQTSENINKLGEIIENDQKQVMELSDVTEDVDKLREEGSTTVSDLADKAVESNQAAEEIFNTVKETKNSAKEIEQASSTIQDIAEQTNLLALNASIEAARAGESGSGFAVVADEIRQLAERSNEHSEEISKIVRDLNKKSDNAVSTMETLEEVVKAQTEGVENTKEKFQGISQGIQKIKENVESLRESSEEMRAKKEEITTALQELSAIAEENSSSTQEISSSVEEQTASMDEIAKASDSLAQLAEEMQQQVSKFKY